MAGAVPPGAPPNAAQVARGTLGGTVVLEAAHHAFAQAYLAFAVISAILMLIAAAMIMTTTAATRRASARGHAGPTITDG
jgi:hypothetical protein